MTTVALTPETRTHYFRPRGTALEAMKCRDAELIVSGPAGTGKSRALLEKLHLAMLVNRGARGLIVRKTLASLGSTGLVTWREHVVPEALLAGDVRFYGGSSERAAQYIYSNGASVTIGGLDRATKIMSSEYDMVYVQEAIELTESDWEAITTRLRNGVMSFQQIMGDTNPDTPTHWLIQRCNRGQTTLLNSRHEDNPILFHEDGTVTPRGAEYISKLDNLTGVRKERLRHGRWVAAEGLVYDSYDPFVHNRKIVKPPDSWPRYWSVDFGYTNPMVIQCWAEDPDGRLHLYRELYQTGILVEDMAKKILDLVRKRDGEWREPKPRAIICDHDAEDRATLERHLGMSTVPAPKTISDGIQAVQARMKVQADGRPRIYFSPAALVERDPELASQKKPCGLIEELPGYIWEKPLTVTPASERKPAAEKPLKRDDHSMDAMRYVVSYRDHRPRTRVRWSA